MSPSLRRTRLSTPIRALTVLLSLHLVFLPTAGAGDLPSGPQVVAGQVSFGIDGTQMNIAQGTSQAIVNWESFSVGAAYGVDVVQPSAAAMMLCRVVGQEPSSIFGSLTANGSFYLVNTNGVLFGPDAQINAAEFMASALQIADRDFLSGRLQFQSDPANGAGVANQGDIVASRMVALLGADVENAGRITAPQVLLGAGSQVVLDRVAGGAVTLNRAGLTGTVWNSGTIDASSTSGSGGAITMGGARVMQAGTASADGQTAGGRIAINADDAAALAAGSVTSAASGGSGDGGTVEVLSDNVALFRNGALISVRGGPDSGNGGTVEISGKGLVEVQGTIDLAGPNGLPGALLIDPTDVTVNNDPDQNMTAPPDFMPSGDPDSSTINLGTLNGALAGGNVTITTDSNGAGTGTILIDIGPADTITDAGAGTDLTLLADADIVMPQGAVIVGGALTMLAGLTDPTGSINVAAPLQAGVIDLGAANSVAAGELTSTTDLILVSADSGSVDLTGPVTAQTDLVITAGGDLTATDLLFAGSSATLVAGGSVMPTGGVFAVADLLVYADMDVFGTSFDALGGSAEVLALGAILADSASANTNVTMDAGTDLTVVGDVLAGGTASLTGNTATVLGAIEAGALTVDAQQDIDLTNLVSTAGSLWVQSVTGPVAVTGDIDAATDAYLAAGTDLSILGNVLMAGSGTLDAGAMLNVGGSITGESLTALAGTDALFASPISALTGGVVIVADTTGTGQSTLELSAPVTAITGVSLAGADLFATDIGVADGPIALAGTGFVGVNELAALAVSVSAGDAFSALGPVYGRDSVDIMAGLGGVVLNSTAATGGLLGITADGTIQVDGAVTADSLAVTAGVDALFGSAISATGGDATIGADANGSGLGSVNLGGPLNAVTGVTLTGANVLTASVAAPAGPITITGAQAVGTGELTGQTLLIAAGGSFTGNGALTGTDAIDITAGGAVTLNGPVTAGAGLTIGSGADILAPATLTGSNVALLTSGGSICLADIHSTAGAITLSALNGIREATADPAVDLLAEGPTGWVHITSTMGPIGDLAQPLRIDAAQGLTLQGGDGFGPAAGFWAILAGTAGGETTGRNVFYVGPLADFPPTLWNGMRMVNIDSPAVARAFGAAHAVTESAVLQDTIFDSQFGGLTRTWYGGISLYGPWRFSAMPSEDEYEAAVRRLTHEE